MMRLPYLATPLTYAGRRSLADVGGCHPAGSGDITGRRAGCSCAESRRGGTAAESHVDNALDNLGAVSAHQRHRDLYLSEVVHFGVRSQFTPPRRGLTATWSRRPGAVHRIDARPSSPLLATKAGAAYVNRPRFGPMVAYVRDDFTVPIHVLVSTLIVHSGVITNKSRVGSASTAWAHVRDWIHVDNHDSAVRRIWTEAARPNLISSEGERDNLTVLGTPAATGWTAIRTIFDHVTDEAAHENEPRLRCASR